MTHREALEQIVREAQEYAVGLRLFQLSEMNESCPELVLYRNGIRDGMAAAARVAQKALNTETQGAENVPVG